MKKSFYKIEIAKVLGEWAVRLKIDNQYFEINTFSFKLEIAKYHARMLNKAIKKLIKYYIKEIL